MRNLILLMSFIIFLKAEYMLEISSNGEDYLRCVHSIYGISSDKKFLQFTYYNSSGSLSTRSVPMFPNNPNYYLKNIYTDALSQAGDCSLTSTSKIISSQYLDYTFPSLLPEPTSPFTPDENGLIMGMLEKDFHFAMAIYGVSLAFLLSIGLIFSL